MIWKMVLWLCSTLLLRRSKMIWSKMLALYMCTIDGDCGGSGGGGGGWYGYGKQCIWEPVKLFWEFLEIVNNQFILKGNVASMEWLILDFWSFCLWYAQFKVVLYVQGFFKPWYSLWSKWQLSLNGSHHEVMQSLTANSYKSVMENY